MQARQFPGDLFEARPDFVVLAPNYPNLLSNGGEFIRTRVQAYAAAGLRGHVIDYSAPPGSKPITRHSGEGGVTHVGSATVAGLLDHARDHHLPLVVHSPTPAVSRLLHKKLPGSQFAVWYHGYEVRDFRRLIGNFDREEMALAQTKLDASNTERFAAAAPLFADKAVTKVFVSDFQRRHSEWDVGSPALNSHIIPNHIDTDTYRPRVRQPDEVTSILLMRSFAARNYSNDVALRAIEMLSNRRGFGELTFTVRGFGRLFEDEVKVVRRLANVNVEHRYSGPAEMAMAHYDHGVFLCPSRYDTQGVMLGEAMASGMVTITNPVAGIPEFTDESCSLLPRVDDPSAFADALWHLVTHPELMPTLSRNAAARVAQQCGADATISKELDIIGSLAP